MTRTGKLRELVGQHIATDPAFAEALLREGIDSLLSGDLETGKTILRDYIEAAMRL